MGGAFADLMALLDPPMVVVTTAAGSEQAGCLVGFHSQCSIHPARYAVWLSTANRTYRVARDAEHLAVHMLSAADHDVAALFGAETGDEVDKFAQCAWEPGPGGVPLLAGVRRRVVGRKVALLDAGGDHACAVVAADAAAAGAFEPMRFRTVRDMEAGHQP